MEFINSLRRSSRSRTSVSTPSAEDQQFDKEVKIALLNSSDVPAHICPELLQVSNWDVDEALRSYKQINSNRQHAQKGKLTSTGLIQPSEMRGIINGGNTCYIDSLLFAMFATADSFDYLLTTPVPEKRHKVLPLGVSNNNNAGPELEKNINEAEDLQESIAFLVNSLRLGKVVYAWQIQELRSILQKGGWVPTDIHQSQQDVSELYQFLAEKLYFPAIKIKQSFIHEAKIESPSDTKITCEHIVQLSLPREDIGASTGAREMPGSSSNVTSNANSYISLEQILEDNLLGSTIEGLRRNEKSVSGLCLRKIVIEDETPKGTIFPFCLNRYSENELTKSISVPLEIDFTPFVVQDGQPTSDNEDSNEGKGDDTNDGDTLPTYESHFQKDNTSSIVNQGKDEPRRDAQLPSYDGHFEQKTKVTPPSSPKASTGRPEPESQLDRLYILRLRSVVCHKGPSLNSGHYISWSCFPEKNQWIRFDDMGSPEGPTVTSISSIQEMTLDYWKEFGQESYLLFYELDTIVDPIEVQRYRQSCEDAKLAKKIMETNLQHPTMTGHQECSVM